MRGLMVCALALMAGGAEAAVLQYSYTGNTLTATDGSGATLPGLRISITLDTNQIAPSGSLSFGTDGTTGAFTTQAGLTVLGSFTASIPASEGFSSGMIFFDAAYNLTDWFFDRADQTGSYGVDFYTPDNYRASVDGEFSGPAFQAPRSDFIRVNLTPSVVPLPASGIALLMGLTALGAYRRRA